MGVVMTDKFNGDGNINDALITVQKALVGIGDLEEGVVQKIKEHLDKMLNNIYTQIKSHQLTSAQELMLSENPITETDRTSLSLGLARISEKLNEKNVELARITAELRALGISVPLGSTKSLTAIRQSLDELNRRNRTLRQIQQALTKHPMITGKIPKGISLSDVEKMLKMLDKQIRSLHQANNEFKQQMKPQNKLEHNTETKIDHDNDTTPKFGRH